MVNRLALRAFSHVAAVFLKILGQMVGADAALQITRHGVVNEFRIRQIEVVHDVPELLQRALLAEPRIAFFSCAMEETCRPR